jgi:putative NADPH-quinone reductase
VLNGNPDPAPERLSFALAESYAAGARSAGHVVERQDIGTLALPILRSAAEFGAPSNAADIIAAQRAVLWAQHLVFVYPIWLGGPPALFKAFLEQLSCGGALMESGGPGFPHGKLGGRSARVIVTMGMPSFAYRFFFGAHGTKFLERSVLRLAGLSPIRTSYFGGVGRSEKDAHAWLAKVHQLGLRAS